MLRRTPVLAVLLSLAITFIGIAPTQAAPPEVTAITSSAPTIYPAINTAKRPGSTTITVETSEPSAVEYVDIRDSLDTLVKEIQVSGSTTTTWDGRDTNGTLVAAGSYTIRALNSAKEAATAVGTVTVSRQHLIRKTFIKTGTAGRYAVKYVGRCSTLRKPSRRGWAGSLGFYANTKCKAQTWNASAVVAVYVTRVPAAERYIDMHVDTYGGAAKAKPRSRGAIEYWSNTLNDWTATKFVGSKVAWHNGLTRSATPMVDSDRYLGWRFAAAYKAQYDVKRFRLVVRYDVLSAS